MLVSDNCSQSIEIINITIHQRRYPIKLEKLKRLIFCLVLMVCVMSIQKVKLAAVLQEIALHFCYWLDPSYQVFFFKAFTKLVGERADVRNLKWHISKITDNIEEVRNLLDTIPQQEPDRNRLNEKDEDK